MRIKMLAAVALTASIFVAGCGQSSKTGSSTANSTTASPSTTTTHASPSASSPATSAVQGRPLTRRQLIARADAICGKTNTKLSTLSIITKKEFARLLPQVAVYYTTETSELGKLVPPPTMAHAWQQILSGFQQYTTYTNTVAGYARANNFTAAAPIIRTAEVMHHNLAAFVKQSGFRRCSRLG
jgi:hypothetical protein